MPLKKKKKKKTNKAKKRKGRRHKKEWLVQDSNYAPLEIERTNSRSLFRHPTTANKT